jgi:hypothetical protein
MQTDLPMDLSNPPIDPADDLLLTILSSKLLSQRDPLDEQALQMSTRAKKTCLKASQPFVVAA